MNSKNIECARVQENIAWGRSLSDLEQNHMFSCKECNNLALEFEEIDSAIKNLSIEIPDKFADVVMERIMATESEQANLDKRIVEFIIALVDNQILRWGIGGTSLLLAFSAH